ncbi:hypothetical protein NDU88_008742 [Pleurodeles waltl]|uniref:Uncharacterized protein n=1 Tax=Pleurodeles waltl TaxID=8319 RepID=A0AAV7RWL4_PLEWA|nr:hypothetical protein NDU88_008742 [Pleurodeles waltl]
MCLRCDADDALFSERRCAQPVSLSFPIGRDGSATSAHSAAPAHRSADCLEPEPAAAGGADSGTEDISPGSRSGRCLFPTSRIGRQALLATPAASSRRSTGYAAAASGVEEAALPPPVTAGGGEHALTNKDGLPLLRAPSPRSPHGRGAAGGPACLGKEALEAQSALKTPHPRSTTCPKISRSLRFPLPQTLPTLPRTRQQGPYISSRKQGGWAVEALGTGAVTRAAASPPRIVRFLPVGVLRSPLRSSWCRRSGARGSLRAAATAGAAAPLPSGCVKGHMTIGGGAPCAAAALLPPGDRAGGERLWRQSPLPLLQRQHPRQQRTPNTYRLHTARVAITRDALTTAHTGLNPPHAFQSRRHTQPRART